MSKAVLIGLDAAVSTLIDSYVRAGMMPNLAQLIERGGYTHIRSVFPGVTPINWATISTGAYPHTHGITDFMVLDEGDPLDGGRDGFIGETYQAETLWQAAARQNYRVATLNFPGAEASQHENHLWIAGNGSPAGRTPYAVANMQAYATAPYAVDLRDSIPVELKDRKATLYLKPQYTNGDGLQLLVEVQDDGLHVSAEGETLTALKPGQISPWLWSSFDVNGISKKCSYRLELTSLNTSDSAFAIVVSQITCPADIASDGQMAEALVKAVGPYIGYCGARGYDRGWVPVARMVEDGTYKGRWLAKAAYELIATHGYDLVMLKWHLLDHIQHAIWGSFDPISPWYEVEMPPEEAGHLMQRSYAAADDMVGTLLPLLDEGVTLVVVSDHGHLPHIKAVALNNLLARQGLLAIKEGTYNTVDWSRTKAFGGPALGHIWINLEGRQPQGVVKAANYDAVCQQVIDLLLELKDPSSGDHPVAKAVRREEAAEFGLGGKRTGDVVYWMTPGYSGDFNWSPLSLEDEVIVTLDSHIKSTADYGEGKFIADKFQSVHGCGDPTASLGRGSELPMLAMAGPKIKAGNSCDELPELTAVAATLARAAGLPRPAQAEDQVLVDWLKD